MYPYSTPNILAKAFTALKAIKWNTLLDGTGKTLGVINQAIPIVYQVKPLFSNAKTIFKIADEINNSDSFETGNKKDKNNTSPIFYI